MRTAEIVRKTNETDIYVSVNLDGTGSHDMAHRHRLSRPYAGSAGAALADRHQRRGQGRPAHRLPPHGRGCRHRARRSHPQGARRQEGHPALRQHPTCRWMAR